MIYLDNNATTPVDPLVVEAIVPFLKNHYGNPSSGHELGQTAAQAIAKARSQVAALIHCQAKDVIFTGCATEANNIVLQGVAARYQNRGKHIITSAIEHPSIMEVCRYLAGKGFKISFLPVNSSGIVEPESLQKTIRKDTILVSIMHANNEIGTIQPIDELSNIARQHDIIFHCDAAQSIGKIPVDTTSLGVDFLTLAGHKFYAPKGIGALFVRDPQKLLPLHYGGGQEQGIRPGTENVAYIVGFGKACEIAEQTMPTYVPQLRSLRDLLLTNLRERLDIIVHGEPDKLLPNTANICFAPYKAQQILAATENIAASIGAACHHSGMSHVFQAMQVTREVAESSIRFSVGKFNSQEDIIRASDLLVQTVMNN